MIIRRAAKVEGGEDYRTRMSEEALDQDFEASSDEVAANKLSVWDRQRTTVPEMLRIMGKPQDWPVYELDSKAASKIESPCGGFLRVEDDPDGLPPAGQGAPGAEGHCALIGAIRPRKKKSKKIRIAYRKVRRHLASLCRSPEALREAGKVN